MILVDTGPLVALFDPADGSHARCVRVLRTIDDVLRTTVPVLTEAFDLLSPASIGAQRLMDFVEAGGVSVRDLDDPALNRAFELMVQYADHPMDLADASLVVAAELDVAKTVFTIDRRDFGAYRYKRGHRHYRFELIG